MCVLSQILDMTDAMLITEPTFDSECFILSPSNPPVETEASVHRKASSTRALCLRSEVEVGCSGSSDELPMTGRSLPFWVGGYMLTRRMTSHFRDYGV